MLQKYLLNSVFRMPEDGGGAPPVVAEPPVIASDPPIAGDPALDPPSEPEVQPQPTGDRHPAWALRRISEENARARQAEERAAAAERRAAEAESLAQRLQADPQAAPTRQPAIPASDGDRQAEIQRAATQQRLYEDSMDVKNRGIAQFGPAFGETLNILSAVGATNDEFIADVLAVDKGNAHALLQKIAKDPERAVALVQMTTRQRIAELTRMADAGNPSSTEAPKVPAPKGVSKAPPPPPPVQPSASKITDWRADDASDDEFDKGFNEMIAKRSARR